MRYVILILFLASVGSIITGYFSEFDYSEKLIGFGVVGLFFVVFPLFIFYRWRKRSVKDYMITNENLEKMREFRKNEK